MTLKRRPMSTAEVKVTRYSGGDGIVGAVMVVRGGIGGVQASLDLAESGFYEQSGKEASQ